jgi:hypothetical protein
MTNMNMYKLILHLFFLTLFVGGGAVSSVKAQDILGCDPAILDRSMAIIDAMNQAGAEIAAQSIQPPTSVEQLTCVDQQLEVVNSIGGLQANPGGNISASIAPFAQQPLMQQVTNFANSAMNVMSGIDNAINNAFSNITSGFLGGLGGGNDAPNTNCEMMEQAWLINNCIEMPQLPSVSDILGGKVAEITGAVGNIANMANPDRLVQQACSAADGALQSYFGDMDSAFDDAASQLAQPITDL